MLHHGPGLRQVLPARFPIDSSTFVLLLVIGHRLNRAAVSTCLAWRHCKHQHAVFSYVSSPFFVDFVLREVGIDQTAHGSHTSGAPRTFDQLLPELSEVIGVNGPRVRLKQIDPLRERVADGAQQPTKRRPGEAGGLRRRRPRRRRGGQRGVAAKTATACAAVGQVAWGGGGLCSGGMG